MIDLTPLEVRKKKGDFRRIMRGYDPATVDDFIDLAADRLEELVRENMALTERLSKQDQQVAEYRERERALTDALVSAQEMREEIRKQTTRDAELAMQTSEQETSQLRRRVEEETTLLRTTAEREAVELREAAQREAEALRSSAKQEADQILSSARRERERTEDALQHVQAMQRQFLESYRALLQRELSELEEVAQSVESAGDDVTTLMSGLAAAAGASELTIGQAAPQSDAAAEPDAAAPDFGVFEPYAAEPFEPEPFVPDDRTVQPPAGDPLADVALDAEPAANDAVLELDTEDEDLAAEAIESLGDILGSLGLSSTAEADEPSTSVDAGGEMELYDALAPEDEEAGVPGPIGLSGISVLDEGDEVDYTRNDPQRPSPDGVRDGFSHERGVVPVTPPPDTSPADGDVVDQAGSDDDDDDTTRLLRNATAAGYSLPDEDELLLSDAIDVDEVDDDEDDGWLPSLLDEEGK